MSSTHGLTPNFFTSKAHVRVTGVIAPVPLAVKYSNTAGKVVPP